MNVIRDLFTNKMFVAPLISWLIAQLIKTIIHFCINKEFDIKRLFGDGGMPSGHSATVMALTTVSAIVYGVGSPFFAICSILAIIVMNDATGVRRETGIHAEKINAIFETLMSKEISEEDKLKVLVGHTPLQVIMGALLGISVALTICFVF